MTWAAVGARAAPLLSSVLTSNQPNPPEASMAPRANGGSHQPTARQFSPHMRLSQALPQQKPPPAPDLCMLSPLL
jgi:hypothetical protein